MEIERKFLISKLPDDIGKYRFHDIEQAYICSNPTLRIRKKDDKYIFTYKSKIKTDDMKGDMPIVNNEIEEALNKEAYEHLLKKRDGNIVTKRRYLIPYDEKHTIELDVFSGMLTGLVMAEVEFESIEDSKEFVKPGWFGKEVSADKRYSNRYLSTVDKYWE